ncbi:MAG: methylmalonyl Co-A mutase-associated GTPase MeaB [Longimicrobiales bacterium]
MTMHSELLSRFDRGERAALGRAITIVENQRPGFEELLETLYPRLGRAHRIGITGPPGAGKSTLSSALAAHWREQGLRVGIVAVDPTSPFTGGALLGDRIRMNDHALDNGVFIRSMATRGALGGLSLATKEVADVMDAFGFDRIIVETVGVGQSELDVAAAADTTVVVLVPESGDSIQAMKAGLMEAADLFVINKSDRPGADKLSRELSLMLHFRHGRALRNVPAHHGVDLSPADWSIPVLKTIAGNSGGVPELSTAIEQHGEWLDATGERTGRRRHRLGDRVREQVARGLDRLAWKQSGGEALLADAIPDLEQGRLTPYALAARILLAVRGSGTG